MRCNNIDIYIYILMARMKSSGIVLWSRAKSIISILSHVQCIIAQSWFKPKARLFQSLVCLIFLSEFHVLRTMDTCDDDWSGIDTVQHGYTLVQDILQLELQSMTSLLTLQYKYTWISCKTWSWAHVSYGSICFAIFVDRFNCLSCVVVYSSYVNCLFDRMVCLYHPWKKNTMTRWDLFLPFRWVLFFDVQEIYEIWERMLRHVYSDRKNDVGGLLVLVCAHTYIYIFLLQIWLQIFMNPRTHEVRHTSWWNWCSCPSSSSSALEG